MRVGLRITGVDQAVKGVAAAAKRAVDAFEAATFAVATDIAVDLQPGIPVLTGETRDSLIVTREMPVEIKATSEQAIFAHEVGPKRKFLQRPFVAASSSVRARIAAKMPAMMAAGETLQTVRGSLPDKAPSPPGRQRPRRRKSPVQR